MTTTEISKLNIKQQLKIPNVKKRFEDVLGLKAPQFITSLINVVNSSQDLSQVDQSSVVASALVAASLNLPINPSFGYMYLVPYKGKAQPQMGYKGYIQLAQRSGQYLHLNAIAVYEDEFKGWNPLTEEIDYEPHFHNRDAQEQPVGYVGYFKLQNGFEKTVYWTREQIDQHRQRFSKMSGKHNPTGVWATDFDAMALKTVLRNLIGKWGPMTVDMQTAYNADEEVADASIDEETKDVTPEEPATDISQLTGGENSDNSSEKQTATKATKPTAKASEQSTTVGAIQQEDLPF